MYDAAAVVGQTAGLTSPAEPVPPERLIEAFCTNQPHIASYVGDVGRTTVKERVTINRGFCGYNGARNDDSLVTGFDDGYDFMGYLQDRGWRPLPAKGDWPYVVYLRWVPRDGDGTSPAIVEYCEADFTIWTFATPGDAQAHYGTLRDQS